MSIVVFGSINMDLVARAAHLPQPGETLIGHSFATTPGGKGANQAVACVRMGVPTRMVGRVGCDVFGDALLKNLEVNNIDYSYVIRAPQSSSGVALIEVNDQGENHIIVIPGANGKIDAADLARLDEALAGARILLLQLEIPLKIVSAAADMAHRRGIRVILDPAPACQLPDALGANVDILTPNKSEASVLVGFPVTDRASIEAAAQVLLGRGFRHVIIKLGGQGVYTAVMGKGHFVPAISVPVVDTVAAGDAFNATLAAALYEAKPLNQAIEWGLAGGALAVTKVGAQEAMPSRDAVLKLLSQTKKMKIQE
ncbi:MAG: ribokinase [Anaerolineae bacterium]|nr:ribokinase [Anaerolineae bacterium]